jgi:Mg2+-importing ATPase
VLGRDIEALDDAALGCAGREDHGVRQDVAGAEGARGARCSGSGHTVGFLGDGINDAPALREADVGISVDTAVDIAKESADIILLEKNLMVLEEGVIEGRVTFGNIMKYIKMTASSNFGNVFSVLIASAFLPFLPMLPLQMLVQNLLYDISQLSIPFDRMDEEYLRKPRKWDAGDIGRFMVWIGPVSSVFDITTFWLMWYVFGANDRRAPVAVPVGLVHRRPADADAGGAHDPHAQDAVPAEQRLRPRARPDYGAIIVIGMLIPYSDRRQASA